MQVRFDGQLKKWNAERGFGFIQADDGGQDLFVHVSAFARDGRLPLVGERLSFEVEPDRDGKKRAIRVRRPGDKPAVPTSGIHTTSRREPRVARHGKQSNFLSKLISFALIAALGGYAYNQYTARAAKYGSALPAPPVQLFSSKLPVPAGFQCDGRNMCSQMTSCREATLFLQNCPGAQMDGNGDGVPCEQQWCTR